jgi:predicted amidohydrolase
MRLACAQLAPVIGDVAGNRTRAARAIERAARTGANMVVLPELCNSGYVFADTAEARSLAEPLDGPTVTAWRELSARYGIVAVGGICELGEDADLSNTAVTIDNGVVVSVYRKAHLWDREQLVFSPGSTPAPVVRTTLGPIGVAICYDAFFPEVTRALALDGALLIAVPMNTPVVEPVLAPLAAEIVLAIAAATCNRVFVAQCDRTGQGQTGGQWQRCAGRPPSRALPDADERRGRWAYGACASRVFTRRRVAAGPLISSQLTIPPRTTTARNVGLAR